MAWVIDDIYNAFMSSYQALLDILTYMHIGFSALVGVFVFVLVRRFIGEGFTFRTEVAAVAGLVCFLLAYVYIIELIVLTGIFGVLFYLFGGVFIALLAIILKE